jgi:hypothetical protein
MLFNEFQDAMRDDGDTDDSIRQKTDTMIARLGSTMEALEIEGIESTTLDDDRSVPLDALAPEQAAIAREIIDAVQYKTKKVILLQGSRGTGKTHTVRVILSVPHRLGIHCLVRATTGIAAIQCPGGKLFMLCSVSVSMNAKAPVFSPMSVAVLRVLIIYYRPV